ncbi:unnamed protein product [Mycena citricolor]|uniref:Uncharacterized protein n=1 Tax=Mycena citricolor TaxID=2018698 RepID=A0AAD2HAL5_9AGAR|nr:unnamed protein product [Mycena citricolor]CAK5271531.1 unnamed protein product [Mycena citricolor]
MNTPLPRPHGPPGSFDAQASREIRRKRLQARFRDREGVFVPRTHNNLLDILQGNKDASAQARSRSRSRSRSASVSPTKGKKAPSKRVSSVARKSGGTAFKRAEINSTLELDPSATLPDVDDSMKVGTSRRPPSKTAAAVESGVDRDTEPAESDEEVAEPTRKGGSKSGSRTTKANVDKAKPISRRTTSKATETKRKVSTKRAEMQDGVETRDSTADAAKPKKRASKTQASATSQADLEASKPVSEPGPVRRKAGKPKSQVEDPTKPASRTTKSGKGKAKSSDSEVASKGKTPKKSKKRTAEPDSEPGAEKKAPKRRKVQPKESHVASTGTEKTRLEVIPEEDEEEAVIEKVSDIQTPAARTTASVLALDPLPPKVKKRRLVPDDPADELPGEKVAKKRKVTTENDKPARATASDVPKKSVKRPSKKLKENSLSPAVAPKDVQSDKKPPSSAGAVVKRSGPPKSVLERMRTEPSDGHVYDGEPDELDLLR